MSQFYKDVVLNDLQNVEPGSIELSAAFMGSPRSQWMLLLSLYILVWQSSPLEFFYDAMKFLWLCRNL